MVEPTDSVQHDGFPIYKFPEPENRRDEDLKPLTQFEETRSPVAKAERSRQTARPFEHDRAMESHEMRELLLNASVKMIVLASSATFIGIVVQGVVAKPQVVPVYDDLGNAHSTLIFAEEGVRVEAPRHPFDAFGVGSLTSSTRGYVFDAETGKVIAKPTPETIKDREVFTVFGGHGCSAVHTLKRTEDGWAAVDRKPFVTSPAYQDSMKGRSGPDTGIAELCR